jgi:hypothetical protein
MGSRAEAQPPVESVILVGGDPAVLANVLPISLASDFGENLLFEVAVRAVV